MFLLKAPAGPPGGQLFPEGTSAPAKWPWPKGLVGRDRAQASLHLGTRHLRPSSSLRRGFGCAFIYLRFFKNISKRFLFYTSTIVFTSHSVSLEAHVQGQ